MGRASAKWSGTRFMGLLWCNSLTQGNTIMHPTRNTCSSPRAVVVSLVRPVRLQNIPFWHSAGTTHFRTFSSPATSKWHFFPSSPILPRGKYSTNILFDIYRYFKLHKRTRVLIYPTSTQVRKRRFYPWTGRTPRAGVQGFQARAIGKSPFGTRMISRSYFIGLPKNRLRHGSLVLTFVDPITR